MSKHTEGPWSPGVVGGKRFVFAGSPHRCVARIQSTDRDAPGVPSLAEGAANARLIAAAPELREALAAVFECERTGQVWPNGLFDRVRELLAKAEGR